MLAQLLRRLVRMMTDWNFIQSHKTAKLIRNNMLHMSTPFSGSFPSDCQETAIPQSLLTLVNMLLYSTELTSDAYSQPTLSLSQLIMFNCIKRSKENTKSLFLTQGNSIASLSWYDGSLLNMTTRSCWQIVPAWTLRVIWQSFDHINQCC